MVKLNLQKCIAVFVLVYSVGSPAMSQSLFDSVISVDRAAITKYELDQRIRFFELLKPSNNVEDEARNSLIEDRLKIAAARRADIQLTPEALMAAMSDFAKNSNNNLNQLLDDLAQDGVDEQTFRDYVEAGITWRQLVRGRFASRANPTEAEIDRALASAGAQGGIQVLLTEIVLPAPPDQMAAARKIANRLTRIESTNIFSEQAQLLSVAQSRANGGKLEWTNLNDLPAGLRPIISGLRPGQITKPLEITNAIVLFQLLDIAETAFQLPKISAIEYAQLAGPESAVVSVSTRADTCDDLYGLVKTDAALTLTIQSHPQDQITQAIALRLNGLDKNEQSIRPTTEPNQADMIMLCARIYSIVEDVSRSQVAGNLRSAHLTSLADGYLAELRSNSDITYH
jgi:peptidyl-prolyl cis-trans isomerase SurA|tara:strand:- start:1869 stop:3065 length:1197 start_codon:yes stop_codon:yes gene_type:complete